MRLCTRVCLCILALCLLLIIYGVVLYFIHDNHYEIDVKHENTRVISHSLTSIEMVLTFNVNVYNPNSWSEKVGHIVIMITIAIANTIAITIVITAIVVIVITITTPIAVVLHHRIHYCQ